VNPKGPMPAKPDAIEWLTKKQAAEVLKVSEKSIERYATQKRIQYRYVPQSGRRPQPLYNAADVERLRQELYGISPFVIPKTKIENRNGGPTQMRTRAATKRAREAATAIAISPAAPMALLGDMLGRKFIEFSSAAPDRIWIPLGDAAELCGLPRWYLEQAIRDGRLPAHDVSRAGSPKRRWRVRKADLEALRPAEMSIS
jgi:hypothetical protein